MGPPRDLIGYGQHAPNPHWPKNAKVALNFVINYEEGSENCVLHGDKKSEHLLSEIIGAQPYEGQRHMNMESIYEYGSRAGFWRLHRMFTGRDMTCTVFACGMALEKHPEACKAMVGAGWEVASHGYRWIDYQNVDVETEREHIKKTVDVHKKMIGERPYGIYQGKPNERTRELVAEEGGFIYDCDSYADELPYYTTVKGKPQLIVPYTLDTNDMRFNVPQGFNSGDQFFTYLKDSLDCLLEEGSQGAPKMMSVGLHCRIVGRPGRAVALARFMDYAKSKGDDVWICTRLQIAQHWLKNFPPTPANTSNAKL